MAEPHSLYPEIEPFRTGTLPVTDLHTIFYEEVGTASGQPALFLHGGPGVGILPAYRRFFDPARFHLVLPDQRGAGRSQPHTELRQNHTMALVSDLEALRRHLGLGPWLVMGGSWGVTLALCYAIAYPQSVQGLILRGAFLARPAEIDWLFRGTGAAHIFPEQWAEFLTVLPPAERADPVQGYHKLLNSDDPHTRLRAAQGWARWEASIMNLIPDPAAIEEIGSGAAALSFGTIGCHYAANNFFMPSPTYLLDNVAAIRHIPCHIIQGRYDVICPVSTAWDLHQALPESQLTVVPDGGHSPISPGMVTALVDAVHQMSAEE